MELVDRIEAARMALETIESAEEAIATAKFAESVRYAAKQAGAGLQIENEAFQLRARAARRAGQLLQRMAEEGERAKPGTNPKWSHDATTLSDLGITKWESQRYQDVARIEDATFESYLSGEKSARLTMNRLLRVGREQKRPAEDHAPVVESDRYDLRHGDLRDVLSDLDGRADAIITDPPYPAEFIEEYDALGEVAARVLKPEGLLVAMVGQTHLPAYIERLGRHLTYRWCGAYLTDGPATRVHGRKVGTKWKPLLIFGGKEFITQDVFASRGDDKQHHHWGQSESGMADIVERLTKPGQLVIDPFLGGGTTAVVCHALGREFIGCDIDAGAIQSTRERLG